MKRFILLIAILCSFAFISCSSSGGGDDLPGLSTAPYNSRKAMSCTMQAILDIAYEININGAYSNVTVSTDGNSFTATNAVIDVLFDYTDYEVSLSGTISVSSGGNKTVFDVTLSRCQSSIETLYCTFHIEANNKNGKTKYTKVILNGKEYEYDLD